MSNRITEADNSTSVGGFANAVLCAVCGSNTDKFTSVLSYNEDKFYCPDCLKSAIESKIISECSSCGYSEFYKSDIPEYSDMCDCCAANKSVEDLEIAWSKELEILNKQLSESYDFDSFCLACYGEEGKTEIKRSDLKGLPELLSVYESEIGNWIEYNRPDLIFPNGFQLEIDFSGLSF